jgi:hypothetical protein
VNDDDWADERVAWQAEGYGAADYEPGRIVVSFSSDGWVRWEPDSYGWRSTRHVMLPADASIEGYDPELVDVVDGAISLYGIRDPRDPGVEERRDSY